MSDSSQDPSPPKNPGANQPPSPYSDQLESFVEALECLYIRGNISGRRIFVENWPAAVPFIFDAQLLTYDREGIGADENKEHRRELEKQAEQKRAGLLETLENIEKHSVRDGMLQIDYVVSFLNTYKRDLAAYVYSEHIIEKLLPAKGESGEELSDEELNVGGEEENTPSEEQQDQQQKTAMEEEITISDTERAEILSSLGPKLPELEEEDKKPKKETKERKYNRKNIRDPNYRPPVVSSSGAAENNSDNNQS